MKPSSLSNPEERKPYQRRSPTEWKTLIELYENSDLTQEAFCRKHGIAPSGLYAWRKRLQNDPTSSSPTGAPTLIDITPQITPTTTASESTPKCHVELEIGGCLLRIMAQ